MPESKKQFSKVGIKDIAAECNVSTTSVSLVLNDRPGVSDQTRRRIQKKIKDLGYRPSQSAKSLGQRRRRTRKSREIALLAFGISVLKSHSYYGPIMLGVTSQAQELGMQTKAESISADNVKPDDVDFDELSGLIITGNPPHEFMQRAIKASVPYVLVACSRALVPGDYIRAENIESSYEAVKHLADLGHKRIAFLGGEKSNPECWERYAGYLRAIDEAGCDRDPELEVFTTFDSERNQEGMEGLLAREIPYTAIFASQDYLAIGVYHVAHEVGLEIPNDISVVGFDDIEPARFLRPMLTTIQTDQVAIGTAAVDRLMQIIEGDDTPLGIRVPTKLVVRDSCQPPKR